MEVNNVSDTALKTLVIRMLKKLRERIAYFSENFNTEIGNFKKET